MEPVRERRHRLPPQAYRGRVICAFTIHTATGTNPLLQPAVFDLAERALAEAFEQYHGRCGVYVFMPNHAHIIISGRGPESDLLKIIAGFKQKATYRVRRAGRPFAWQKDFYDHIIRTVNEYAAQVRYVLRNPVRRGLCERWEDWRYKGALGQTWEQLAASIASC